MKVDEGEEREVEQEEREIRNGSTRSTTTREIRSNDVIVKS